MSLSQLHLVSFPICPYVQRSVITLKHKGLPFDITYIDPRSPPDWFREKSPTGKVPLLIVGEKEQIFESAVINEYLDEISPPGLLPEDPLRRGQMRAWIVFGSDLLGVMHRWMTAQNQEAFEAARDEIATGLHRLEEQCSADPYFAGSSFSLLDSTLAPLFTRLSLFNDPDNPWQPEQYPQLSQWWQHLATLPEVQNSVIADFHERLSRYLRSQEGYAGPRLADQLDSVSSSGH